MTIAHSLSAAIHSRRTKWNPYLSLAFLSFLPFTEQVYLFNMMVFGAFVLEPILPRQKIAMCASVLTSFVFLNLNALILLPVAFVSTLFFKPVKVESNHGHSFIFGIMPAFIAAVLWLSIRYSVDPSSQGTNAYVQGIILSLTLVALPLSSRIRLGLLIPWLVGALFALTAIEEWIRPDFNLESLSPIQPIYLGMMMGLASFPFAQKQYKESFYFGVGIGVLLVSFSASISTAIWCLVGALSFQLVWAIDRRTRVVVGLSIIVLLPSSFWFNEKSIHLKSRHYNSIQLKLNDASFGGANSNGAYSTVPVYEEMSLFVNNGSGLTITLDGSTISTKGRAARAERFMGRVAGLLSNNVSHTVITGDHVGNVYGSLLKNSPHLESTYSIVLPNVDLAVQTAKQYAKANALWMSAHSTMIYQHRQQSLQGVDKSDLYLDIVHSPWGDSDSPVINEGYIKRIKNRLSQSGTYGLLVHLRNWEQGLISNRLQHLGSQFKHLQIWLPASGIDSILVFASDQEFRFDLFVQKMDTTENAYRLAAHAIGSHGMLKKWTLTGVQGFPSPANSPARQLLHLTELSQYFDSPKTIWGKIDDGVNAELTQRHSDKISMLNIYNSASGGRIEDAFNDIAQLRKSPQSSQAMWPLIQSHVAKAKAEVKLARSEGALSKHWDEAKRFAISAQLISPNSIEPQLLLGEISIAKAEHNEAIKHFQKAYEIDALSRSAIDGLARCYGLKKDTTNTEKWLKKAIETYPRDWKSHLNLGRFLHRNNQLKQAEDHLQRAASLSDGKKSAASMALTDLYLDLNQPTRALVEIERQIKIKPNGYAWFLRARAHFALEQYDKAENDFRRATLQNPNLHEARGGVGLVRIAKGDLEGAAQAFRATLKFDPNNKEAKENLVRLEKEIKAKQALNNQRP